MNVTNAFFLNKYTYTIKIFCGILLTMVYTNIFMEFIFILIFISFLYFFISKYQIIVVVYSNLLSSIVFLLSCIYLFLSKSYYSKNEK